VHRIHLRAPWRWLTPYIRGFEKYAFSRKGDQLNTPFPDILICSGRRSLPASFYVKKASPKTLVIQLQDPHCDPKLFDMVVVPEHDKLRGPNVVTTLGALNRITPTVLAKAADDQRARFAHLPEPYTAVLIGGTSMIYDFDAATQKRVLELLQRLSTTVEGSLLITTSRRTPLEFVERLCDSLPQSKAWVWDSRTSPSRDINPYFAMLGLAKNIIVTADSVSMISEAAATGRPINIIPLPGGSAKFDRFYEGLAARGVTRPLSPTGSLGGGVQLAEWGYEPIYETRRVAEIIRGKLHG
jgi:mitochondrial fission protein ELM1